jgi:UTP:GlnB (protein PII) uridylyltransferase
LRKLAADYGEEAAAHFAHMPERYFRTFTASEIAGHVRMFRKFFEIQTKEAASGVCPVVKWMHHPEQGHSEVLLCGWDHPGLIVRICGAFLAARVNILSADIHTRTDNLVLDIFRQLLERLWSHRTALGRCRNAGHDLRPVEWLTHTVRFQHHQRHLFDAFVGGEPLVALQARAPTTDGRALVGLSRVDDLGVVGLTGRAAHVLPTLLAAFYGSTIC